MIDIEKIPKYLKTFLINLVLIPFWYISIYIFNNTLYKTQDFLIIISLCICLTIVSSILMSIIMTNSEKDAYILEENVVIPTVSVQVILLSTVIFLGYTLKVTTGKLLNFYGFLITYFSIILFILLCLIIFNGKRNNSKK